LRQFFRNEAIQSLWWSVPSGMGNATKPGFIRSEKLAKLISELSTEEMKKLNILLEQVCPPGQEIIP